jgi:hypothetical protein
MAQRTSFGLFVVLSWLSGCGSEPARFPVSGSVVLDGKPMPDCILTFVPLNVQATGVTVSVDGGLFDTGSTGLVAGDYRLLFNDIQPDLEEFEEARASSKGLPLNRPKVPLRYTVDNELRVTVQGPTSGVTLELKSK